MRGRHHPGSRKEAFEHRKTIMKSWMHRMLVSTCALAKRCSDLSDLYPTLPTSHLSYDIGRTGETGLSASCSRCLAEASCANQRARSERPLFVEAIAAKEGSRVAGLPFAM